MATTVSLLLRLLFSNAHAAPGHSLWLMADVACDTLLATGMWLAASADRRAALAIEIPVFAMVVGDLAVWLVSGRHLREVPAELLGLREIRYVLRMFEYRVALAGCLILLAALILTWRRLTRRAKAPYLRRWGLVLASAACLALAIVTREKLRPGVKQPGQDLVVTAPAELTDSELDLVASVGLPARRHTMSSRIAMAAGASPRGAIRLPGLPPKIILITVESLARNLVHKFNQPHPTFTMPPWVTPNLDRIAQSAVSFNAHGTTMMPTQQGLYATLLSRAVLRRYDQNPRNHQSLAAVLSGAGYETHFLQGDELDYGHMDILGPRLFKYADTQGFREMSAGGLAPSRFWGWGLHDEVLFDTALRKIAAAPDRPQFIHIMTLDLHPPFGADQDLNQLPDEWHGADRMLRALYATDRSIGNFLARLDSDGWTRRGSLVVITADHSPSHWYRRYMPANPSLRNDLIPLFFLHKDLPPGRVPSAWTSRATSQIDVAPSIISLAGLEIPPSWTGRDLFDPDTAPLWVSNESPGLLASQSVDFRTPNKTFRVSNADVTGNPDGEFTSDEPESGTVRALRKWLAYKHYLTRGESPAAYPTDAPAFEVAESLLATYPGGVRVLNPEGSGILPFVNRMWDGSPMRIDGRPVEGVALLNKQSVIVELAPGTKRLRGKCGIMAIPAERSESPTGFSCRMSIQGGKTHRLNFAPRETGVRSFSMNVPRGTTRVVVQLVPGNPRSPEALYAQGYLGDLRGD
ncbi:LTA synthase family protein [bacterium]|nr:LTA synthase family protein [bacterium]